MVKKNKTTEVKTAKYMRKETLPYQGLSEFFELADASVHDWEHTVSWIDCLAGYAARGIFMRANHMTEGEACRHAVITN
jgi:hypothetical protein